MEFVLKGVDKDLLVERARIRIHQRKGFMKSESDKTIPAKKVNSIQLKKPGLLSGYIQFSVAGDQSSVRDVGGSLQAATDENAVLFIGNENYAIAVKIKEYLENLEEEKESGTVSVSPSSPADEIRKYKALADEGIITQEDFEKKKALLLGL